jgi:branched-chain amino acid transport system substrate-binding protein
MYKGAQLAAKEINEEQDGIDGTELEILTADTQGSSSTGKQKFQDLVLEDNVNMTAGVFTSEVLMAIMDDIAETENIHITTGAATPEASALVQEDYEKYKYHFRAFLNAKQLGQAVRDFVLQTFDGLGWQNVAMLVEDWEWTQPFESIVGGAIEATDLNLVMRERYSSDPDFGTLFNRVEANDADVALVAMAHTGRNAPSNWTREERQFAFAGIHVPSQLPGYYSATMGTTEYVVCQNMATPTSELTEKTQPFIQAYTNENGEAPVYTGYTTYDAIHQYAQLVNEGGRDPNDSDDIVDGLEQSSYQATFGTLEYHGQGQEFAHDAIYDENKVTPVYQQWQSDDSGGGVQEVIHPPEFETSDYQKPPWIN